MKFNLEIAEFTRQAQSSNGLRHGDYHRYRHFCTDKLRRVRKSLGMVNGRHKFRKAEFPGQITSPRYLQLFVLQAERAWSHGLTLKSEYALGESDAPGRLRRRYVKKFLRASNAAKEALDFATSWYDARTVLEAEAYHAWLSALALTECGKYQDALKQVDIATEKYGELAKSSLDVIFPNSSKAFKHRISDLEPMARICKYKLRLTQASAEARGEASPARSIGDDFESVYEMSEGEVEFSDSDSEMQDVEPLSPGSAKGSNKGLLGKIGGWWNKA
jgi:signal recognition particle subunit SRP68